MIYSSIVETIGKTPVIRLQHITDNSVDLYVKFEGMNPGGSIKDRLALGIILEAEKCGALRPGQTVIEATSGNTGIGLAMICAARGYPFVAVMTETFSVERRKIMRALGAKVVLTPAEEKGSGMVRVAKELAEKNDWFLADQFCNPANPLFHQQTTAAEILSDFAGKRLDYLVATYGTGGTLSGCGKMLKQARPEVSIVAVEPENAALLAGKPWQSHKIQGTTPDFIADTFNVDVVDRHLTVSDDEARDTALLLAAKEGIMAGISGGAALAGALRLVKQLDAGSSLLVILPDNISRYLSTYLFADIPEGSDEV